MPLFACSTGMAATTEAVAMMVRAVKMRVSIANKLGSWVCSRLIILVKVLVKVMQRKALSFILATKYAIFQYA